MIAVPLMRVLFALSVLAAGSGSAAAETLLVFGDSLSAGYGIARDAGWVNLLGSRLARVKPRWHVVNASISGETSAGGAARLPAALAKYKPDVVLIALGANDGLRGLPPGAMRRNLAAMVEAAQKRGAAVLLVGMKLPPNYGPAYGRQFEAAFATVAERHDTAYLPFLLEGMAAKRDLFQDDQLHPTAAAQPIILDHVWPALEPLLK